MHCQIAAVSSKLVAGTVPGCHGELPNTHPAHTATSIKHASRCCGEDRGRRSALHPQARGESKRAADGARGEGGRSSGRSPQISLYACMLQCICQGCAMYCSLSLTRQGQKECIVRHLDMMHKKLGPWQASATARARAQCFVMGTVIDT